MEGDWSRPTMTARAAVAAGTDDFGDPGWEEGYDRLVADLTTTARLNDVGRIAVESELLTYLTTRLQLIAWRREHPAVAAEEVVRPLVICGQPRTGTTILYDLLAQDPAHRAPITWEVDRPVPPPSPDHWDDDPRIEEVEATLAMTDLVVPGFRAFHPMGARLAQEDVRITGSDFKSMIFTVQYHVPAYNRWLLHQADLASSYRWHRRFLQHLQSGVRGERWLLKTPAHLWHLPALMAEYPDAVLIQTHRDPLRVIASLSALTTVLRSMTCDDPSLAEAAAQHAEDVVLGLDRAMAARDDGTLAADQVVDVQFADFMADPFATIGALYDRLGMPLTPDAESRMRAFLADHPGDGGGGGHRYTFADTGLDAGRLRERVRPYQVRFNVPSEPLA